MATSAPTTSAGRPAVVGAEARPCSIRTLGRRRGAALGRRRGAAPRLGLALF
ncbi:hypothetical protein [Cryptosporangium arvum]|uniref:hypothetical protein n=1 Tax=Cryptosporangium arvum TaxID=80871 RepID=UPI0004B64AB6|nr:hypothetical protein [Cryptosporangium arvum]